jgi:hypothetical protein
MKQFSLYLTLLPMMGKAQSIKLMVYGEHLGYKMNCYHSGNSFQTNIVPGEKWYAVYSDSDRFEVKEETIQWDTTHNFTFTSDTSIQPTFYFQGFQPVKKGTCADVSSIVWTYQDKRYAIANKRDSITRMIKCNIVNEINYDKETALIYAGVKNKYMEGNQFLVLWAGDINGDNQLDFVLRNVYPDTIIYDFIVSNKIKNKVVWKRIARFHEWS